MITVPGRVLSAPEVKYRDNATEIPRAGSWNMSRVKFASGAKVPPWTYLWIKRAGRPGQIEQNKLLQPVVNGFHNMMNACGLDAPAPIVPGPTVELDAKDAKQTNDQLIESIVNAIATSPKKIGLVFVLLPDTDSAVYNKVKHAADIMCGLHTVGSVDAKAAKRGGVISTLQTLP
jgi:eukaryotic translation initiation factor 2C